MMKNWALSDTHVIRLVKASIRKNNGEKALSESGRILGCMFERIVNAEVRGRNSRVFCNGGRGMENTTPWNEAGYNNEQKHESFNRSKRIVQKKTGLPPGAMKNDGECDNRNRDATGREVIDLSIGSFLNADPKWQSVHCSGS